MAQHAHKERCNIKIVFVAFIFLFSISLCPFMQSQLLQMFWLHLQLEHRYPGPYTNAKDPQGLVKALIYVLQTFKTFKKQTTSHGDDDIFKLWGKAQSFNEINPRVNILTDPTYSEPLGFIVIVFIYDFVRVSKEARRRSDALAEEKTTTPC
ncbi:unnamed protein product [Coregonus sp. 'balchen']|nr:unnamed protein product [Coregonus sp. 'balchen']